MHVTIQVPHWSHYTWHHAWNKLEFKLKFGRQSLTSYRSLSLIVILILWKISGIMSIPVIVKTLHSGHVTILAFFVELIFGIGFLSLPLLCLTNQGTIFLIICLRWGSIPGILPELFMHQIQPKSIPIWYLLPPIDRVLITMPTLGKY